MILGTASLTQADKPAPRVSAWTSLALTNDGGLGTVADLSVTTTRPSYVVRVSGTLLMPLQDNSGFRLYVTVGGVAQTTPIVAVEPRSVAGISGRVPFSGAQTIVAAAGAKTIGLTAEYIGEAKLLAPMTYFVEEQVGARCYASPFTGTLAADQTDVDLVYGGMAGGFVATRAGSITGLSAQISAAITGSGTTVTLKVTKNGTEIAGGGVALTEAGAETKGQTTYALGTYAFAAGDVIGVSYTSTTITNTPTVQASVEIE